MPQKNGQVNKRLYVCYISTGHWLLAPKKKNPWMTFKSLPEPNFYKLDRLQCLLLHIPVKRNRMLSLKLQRKVKQLQY